MSSPHLFPARPLFTVTAKGMNRNRLVQEGQGLDGQRAQPVGQGAALGRDAGDGRLPPGRVAMGDAGHEAEGGQVGIAPGIAAEDAGVGARVELFAADHGWCTLDAPSYDKEEANRARLLSLFNYSKMG